jgi:hypothetical protein
MAWQSWQSLTKKSKARPTPKKRRRALLDIRNKNTWSSDPDPVYWGGAALRIVTGVTKALKPHSIFLSSAPRANFG